MIYYSNNDMKVTNPVADIDPHIIIDPLPCFRVGCKNLLSSVNKTISKKKFLL